MAIATYQTGLSTPGGVLRDDGTHRGKAILASDKFSFIMFMFFNSVGFCISLEHYHNTHNQLSFVLETLNGHDCNDLYLQYFQARNFTLWNSPKHLQGSGFPNAYINIHYISSDNKMVQKTVIGLFAVCMLPDN
ncbi:hypothetical protein Ddye_015650 [Dipteronia dyeriana]|uniref:PGG domain-containing protein n=1 Tax=Dipteronia dyeriana TaxID=168575 RepID=A0AAD9U586_9ROSI|nr:hypothetical protein Ddye_015650 [Dipteronia dyeriana]